METTCNEHSRNVCMAKLQHYIVYRTLLPKSFTSTEISCKFGLYSNPPLRRFHFSRIKALLRRARGQQLCHDVAHSFQHLLTGAAVFLVLHGQRERRLAFVGLCDE